MIHRSDTPFGEKMANFLYKRNGTYYFHKRVSFNNNSFLIRQSLKTKCYNSAKILVSLLNFQIHKNLLRGHLMTKQEIEDITYKYFTNGLEEYENLEDLRHEANTVTIRGTTYEGSTEKAILNKMNEFQAINEKRDFKEVKNIIDNQIIPRSGINENIIEELKKHKEFYWKMFKYEIELLNTDLSRYKSYSPNIEQETQSQIFINEEKKDIPDFYELIEEIKKYYKEKRKLKDETIKTYIEAFSLINEVFPNKKINELTSKDCEYLENIIVNLPQNRKKGKLTRELNIEEQTELIKDILNQRDNDIYLLEYEKIQVIEHDTINNYFDRIKFFIKYCSEKYDFKNPVNQFVLESFRITKDPSMDRFLLSDDEIVKIFDEFDYLNKNLLFTLKKDPLKVFGVFLTMYLGLRPSEIGQLMIADLKRTTNKDGDIIYYLEVSKENQSDNTSLNDVKSNKTIYARRKLPLTKILIEKLRILDFINYRKKNKHNFIFVDEKQGKETKNLIKATIRRCESRFNDKIKKIDIEDKEKKSYYSLRHSFANKIKHMPETLRDKRGESLMGHTRNDTELFNRYGNKYFEPDFLVEILEKVEYRGLNEILDRVNFSIGKLLE